MSSILITHNKLSSDWDVSIRPKYSYILKTIKVKYLIQKLDEALIQGRYECLLSGIIFITIKASWGFFSWINPRREVLLKVNITIFIFFSGRWIEGGWTGAIQWPGSSCLVSVHFYKLQFYTNSYTIFKQAYIVWGEIYCYEMFY